MKNNGMNTFITHVLKLVYTHNELLHVLGHPFDHVVRRNMTEFFVYKTNFNKMEQLFVPVL